MAESEHDRARRLERLREQRRLKRERTGDTPEARADREKERDADTSDAVKRRIGDGVIWS